MEINNWHCYENMFSSRQFEASVTTVWRSGKISGEMHLSTGEEAITAGTVLQLQAGDAMALDHRGTSAMLMRGVDPFRLLREFMGKSDGLCHGQGGHMHLFSQRHLAASSGIVGASGPAAAGFALANRTLRSGSVALAFFGDGAMNQGMLLESMNLAVAWRLPVVFICKDSKWAITTLSASVTGGNLVDRATGMGMPATSSDLTVVGVGVSIHRALDAATILAQDGYSAEVIDLRTVSPLDKEGLCASVSKTGRMLVVDEDYQAFGLSGELAAVVLESGIQAKYGRVCVESTIPYSPAMEQQALPNTDRILAAANRLLQEGAAGKSSPVLGES